MCKDYWCDLRVYRNNNYHEVINYFSKVDTYVWKGYIQQIVDDLRMNNVSVLLKYLTRNNS